MGELLTLEEVASRLKIKPETVRRLWLKTGKLPAVKLGRRWRVDEDDLNVILKQYVPPPPLASEIDKAIVEGGLCTLASQQDQLEIETDGREWKRPRPTD